MLAGFGLLPLFAQSDPPNGLTLKNLLDRSD
jgi:hypothetical protein